MATRIGCDNLVYAIMTTEETTSADPMYSAVKAAPGVMSIGVNPNGSVETLFADDGPMETATTLGKIEVEIQKNALTTANKADLLGHKVDTNGALISSDSDVSPWVAIGFRTLKSNGTYKYVWLLKGKFTEPEETNETKGDGVNFQADTIKGQFAKLNKAYTVATKSVRPWKTEADEEDASLAANLITSWFTEPYLPGATLI